MDEKTMDVTGAASPRTEQTHTHVSPVEKTAQATPDEGPSKLAELARREKALRMRAINERRKLDAERSEWMAQKKAFETERAELDQYRKLKTRLVDEPAAVLNEHGVSYDKVTSQYLNAPNPEILALTQTTRALQQKLAQYEQSMKDAQTQQYDQAKKQIRTEAKLYIDSNDTLEAIKAHGEEAVDAVTKLIERTFEKRGYLMPVEQAIQKVEAKLTERALALAQLKKVKEKLAPAPAPIPEPAPQIPKQEQRPSNTLSQRLAPTQGAPRSERERIQRAILAFEGKLS